MVRCPVFPQSSEAITDELENNTTNTTIKRDLITQLFYTNITRVYPRGLQIDLEISEKQINISRSL
tara:strand:- start:35 stop:232 length:198 start_codon:yes stop_codon:yes gene_type:complete